MMRELKTKDVTVPESTGGRFVGQLFTIKELCVGDEADIMDEAGFDVETMKGGTLMLATVERGLAMAPFKIDRLTIRQALDMPTLSFLFKEIRALGSPLAPEK